VSENLDFEMEIFQNEVMLEFKGILKSQHLQAVRERLFSSVEGTNKIYFVVLERVKFRDKNYLNMFLELLNFVKGKDSELVIIFHNKECREFFSPFFHIFKIYDSKDSYRKDSDFWKKLKATGITYNKSTGIRLAPGIAIVFLFLLAGWVLTLFSIISSQDKDIRQREEILRDLQNNYMRSVHALEELKASVAPLKSMGFDIDSVENPVGVVSDWNEFLKEKESK
jgi:anti-anti-sigma regulatory factor